MQTCGCGATGKEVIVGNFESKTFGQSKGSIEYAVVLSPYDLMLQPDKLGGQLTVLRLASSCLPTQAGEQVGVALESSQAYLINCYQNPNQEQSFFQMIFKRRSKS